MLSEFRLKCLTGRMIFSTGMMKDRFRDIDFGIFVSSTLIKAGIQGLTLQKKADTLYKNKLINVILRNVRRSYNPIRLN